MPFYKTMKIFLFIYMDYYCRGALETRFHRATWRLFTVYYLIPDSFLAGS